MSVLHIVGLIATFGPKLPANYQSTLKLPIRQKKFAGIGKDTRELFFYNRLVF